MSTNVKELKKIIEEVIQENFADLEEMFSNEDMLKQFNSRLYQKKIVPKATKDKPTFNQIVKDFNNCMIFMKTENDFRDHCVSFITSLQTLEGPAIRAADVLEAEWTRAIKEKLNLDLKIENNPKTQGTNGDGADRVDKSVFEALSKYEETDRGLVSCNHIQLMPQGSTTVTEHIAREQSHVISGGVPASHSTMKRATNHGEPVKVYHVHRQLKGESTNWNEIGLELGITHNDRENIRKRIDLSNEARLEMVLLKWKESQCSEVSWDRIIDVLRRLELKSVARKVEQYLLTDKDAIKTYGWEEPI